MTPVQPAFFVASTGTDSGKTFLTCALLKSLRARGLPAVGFKPVASGVDPLQLADSDPGRLATAMGLTSDPLSLDQITPWRFSAPLAPPLAAALEGVTLEFEAITGACRSVRRQGLVIYEGAGGVMSPLTFTHTNLDLIIALNVPVILVGNAYLGAVSHTLTALKAMSAAGVRPVHLIVNAATEHQTEALESTLGLLSGFVDLPLHGLAFDPEGVQAAALVAQLTRDLGP